MLALRVKSKIRSFFSAPPVASTCGLAWMGNATARTMCACCSVCRHSPVYVSQTLLCVVVGLVSDRNAIQVKRRPTLRSRPLHWLRRWHRQTAALARLRLCGREKCQSCHIGKLQSRLAGSSRHLPVSSDAIPKHRIVVWGNVRNLREKYDRACIPLHADIK